MQIFIDGYNLLKLLYGPDITEKQRYAYATVLGRYSKKRGHKIVLVFDAGDCTYPMHERHHGITIWYSGIFESADDRLVRLIKEHASKQNVLVTADRQLIERVTHYHIHALDPFVFHKKVQESFEGEAHNHQKEDQSIIKFEHEEVSDPALDELMRYAASMVQEAKDVDIYGDQKQTRIRTDDRSKEEKIQISILNKL